MNKSEQDCFNALTGRTIKSIGFASGTYENKVLIETHDGLKYEIYSYGSELQIKQDVSK